MNLTLPQGNETMKISGSNSPFSMPRKMKRNSIGLIILATAAPFVGCDTGQVKDAVDSGVQRTTQVVEQTVETVKQEANLVGSMELTTDPPLTAKACYAELIDTGEGRPNVFRLASYKSEELERFPSIIVEAHVTETSLTSLAGKSIEGKVYAQLEDNGPVWSTPTGSQVTLSVTKVDQKSVSCECAVATLINSDTGEESSVSGKFTALIE